MSDNRTLLERQLSAEEKYEAIRAVAALEAASNGLSAAAPAWSPQATATAPPTAAAVGRRGSGMVVTDAYDTQSSAPASPAASSGLSAAPSSSDREAADALESQLETDATLAQDLAGSELSERARLHNLGVQERAGEAAAAEREAEAGDPGVPLGATILAISCTEV